LHQVNGQKFAVMVPTYQVSFSLPWWQGLVTILKNRWFWNNHYNYCLVFLCVLCCWLVFLCVPCCWHRDDERCAHFI